MKKLISMIMVFVLCVSMCACGAPSSGNESQNSDAQSQNKKAMVILDNGTEFVTANDICSFSSKYMGKSISVTAKVTRIDGPYYYIDSKPYFDYYDIALEGGWEVRVHDEDPIMSTIKIGDTITAKGLVMDAWVTVLICGYESGRGWNSAATEVNKA